MISFLQCYGPCSGRHPYLDEQMGNINCILCGRRRRKGEGSGNGSSSCHDRRMWESLGGGGDGEMWTEIV